MTPTCLPSGERITQMQTQQYKYKVKIQTTKEYHYFCGTSPDNERPPFALKDEFKAMRGARWLGIVAKDNPIPRNVWRVENCRRNNFNIDYLEGKNPFARYKDKLDVARFNIPTERKDCFTGKMVKLFAHQPEFVAHILQRKQCIVAGEMGTAKTLAAFIAMEMSLVPEVWYIAPKSALTSVKLEAMRWGLRTKVRWMTYDELKKVLSEWEPGRPPPKMVICDESSRVKTASSQRSQAVMFLTESMRDTWGDDAYIVLMSGSPAPKSPLDWYHQCIAEGTPVLTNSGPIAIENVKTQMIWVNGQKHFCNSGAISKGIKATFKILTDEGFEVEATADHRFMSEFGWIIVEDCVQGTRLKIHNQAKADWAGRGSERDGYLIGQMVGDGYKGVIGIWPNDYSVIPTIQAMLYGRALGTFAKDRYILEAVELEKLANYFEMDTEKNINFEGTSKSFIKGYLSALFDCDSTVEKKRSRIQLCQVNLKRLKKVQELLSYFGIMSTIKLKSKAGVKKFQERSILCQDSYTLIISGVHAQNFIKNIGFKYEAKKNAGNELLKIKSQMSQDFFVTVKSVEYAGEKQVYDISVPGPNAFSAAGFYAHNCEIACPGYIREGNIHKFEQRLAILEKTGDTTGYSWSKRIAWRDGNPNICGLCGRHSAQHENLPHSFQPVDNQIEAMYRRMSGLVLVKFKKDCLDLPDKIYRPVYLKPSRELMSAARIVTAKAHSVIEGMTLLRELSDGFQYKDTITKTAICSSCQGTRIHPQTVPGVVRSCEFCSGTGVQNSYQRETVEIPSPKLDALTELLDEVEEQGRVVVYAGFTGSIDRICAHVKKLGWEYIRVDGRGWHSSISGLTTDLSMLRAFQNPAEYPNLAFIGHPGSSGMGITLTAASMIVYYSNDFNAESRIQSEDRIHRAGMDPNRGATIVDLILLPTDKKVLDNLSRKRELQSISLGEIKAAIDNYTFTSA